jgi:hypothetical protein
LALVLVFLQLLIALVSFGVPRPEERGRSVVDVALTAAQIARVPDGTTETARPRSERRDATGDVTFTLPPRWAVAPATWSEAPRASGFERARTSRVAVHRARGPPNLG